MQPAQRITAAEGQRFLGWRTVPTDNSSLGATAKGCEPCIRQAFIGRNASLVDDLAPRNGAVWGS